jgi:uridine kinase
MPVGLDGNPDPVVSRCRSLVLDRVAAAVVALQKRGQVLVAIDGASGTGKSTFADELARTLPDHQHVVRASIDSFHRPRAERYRRGNDSGEGYYRDSHDLTPLRQLLLTPFARGNATMRTEIFDEPSDHPIDRPGVIVPVPGTLILDGLFLHRPELVGYWDLTVYLVADARRDAAWAEYLTGGLPDDPDRRQAEIDRRRVRARRGRYVEGQKLYEQEADPLVHASFVIDNDHLADPRLIIPAAG